MHNERYSGKGMSLPSPAWQINGRLWASQCTETGVIFATPKWFQRYIASHMEEFALFALPRALYYESGHDTRRAGVS